MASLVMLPRGSECEFAAAAHASAARIRYPCQHAAILRVSPFVAIGKLSIIGAGASSRASFLVDLPIRTEVGCARD